MTPSDRSGIIVPPPLLYGAAFVLVLMLQRVWPAPAGASPVLVWAGGAVLAAGIMLNACGVYSMVKAGTPVNPYRPVSTIVTTGAFRLSRNPLYVGLALIFLGVILILNSLWGVAVLVPVLIVMHYGVILREERYLEANFGEVYRAYCARVRRYL